MTALRIAESSQLVTGVGSADATRWLEEVGARTPLRVALRPLAELDGWTIDPDTGDLRHRTNGFFAVEGMRVSISTNPVGVWHQPIISQPEVGLLGILIKEIDGVLHCLMQAKVEPGNCNGVQVSPTVQATRSNYTLVHGGRAVPYLEYFLDAGRHVHADVRQSEQGSAFRRKRNRNMVVEVREDVEVLDGFCWLTLGQIHRLLDMDDLVNMDARTVLSCLPLAHHDLRYVLEASRAGSAGFHASLLRSCSPLATARHSFGDILSWITEARIRTEVRTWERPLRGLPGWRSAPNRISHESGAFFDVVGVRVRAGRREVGGWDQPMIRPYGRGVVAFLVKQINGVLHVLMNTRVEAGYLDVVELAPTVQCTPDNYEYLPATARPRFLDRVLRAVPEQIWYDTVLSEEGGRFYHGRNRYLVVEADDISVRPDDPDFRWMTVCQLVELLRHSHYVNVQARSLVACLYSLLTPVPAQARA